MIYKIIVKRRHLDPNLPVFLTQSTQVHEGPCSPNLHPFQNPHFSQVHRGYLTVVDKKWKKTSMSIETFYGSFVHHSTVLIRDAT